MRVNKPELRVLVLGLQPGNTLCIRGRLTWTYGGGFLIVHRDPEGRWWRSLSGSLQKKGSKTSFFSEVKQG